MRASIDRNARTGSKKFGAGEDLTVENIKDPVISFIFSPQGLMVNASLEGTKISKIKQLK